MYRIPSGNWRWTDWDFDELKKSMVGKCRELESEKYHFHSVQLEYIHKNLHCKTSIRTLQKIPVFHMHSVVGPSMTYEITTHNTTE